MNKFKYILLALLLGGATYKAEAQSNYFSQYHLTPVYTSPAELGATDYFQVLGHYRKQSLSQDQGYRNFALSGICPLNYKDGGRRFGGIGLGIMNENSGMMGVLQETSINAGYAYNLQLSQSRHISVGLQGGYHRRNVNLGKVTTDGQYQNGVYVPGMPTGENFSDGASQAFRADLGATWYAVDEYGDRKYALGVTAFNVNGANYEFLTSSQEQAAPIRYQAYGSFRALSKDKLQIVPTFRYMMEKNYSQLNMGSLFMYQLQEGQASMHESHLGLGAWYSLNNAAIFSLEYAQPSYIVSVSYDLPASSNIDQMQVNNGVEVTFGWRLNKGKSRKAAHEKVESAVVAAPVEKKTEPVVVPVEKQELPSRKEPVVPVKAEPLQVAPVLSKEEAELFDQTIHFEAGKQNLTASSKVLLDEVSEVLLANKGVKVELVGYTDNTGNAEKNQQISLTRAEKSRDYLVQKGVEINRISVKGMGEEKPVASNDNPEGRERNRRVEIRLVK